MLQGHHFFFLDKFLEQFLFNSTSSALKICFSEPHHLLQTKHSIVDISMFRCPGYTLLGGEEDHKLMYLVDLGNSRWLADPCTGLTKASTH